MRGKNNKTVTKSAKASGKRLPHLKVRGATGIRDDLITRWVRQAVAFNSE